MFTPICQNLCSCQTALLVLQISEYCQLTHSYKLSGTPGLSGGFQLPKRDDLLQPSLDSLIEIYTVRILEGVAHTNIPAVIFLDMTPISAFKVNVGISTIGPIEVST